MNSTSQTSLKIAVTGGSGSVGSALVRKLVSLGHDVTILDRIKPSPDIQARFKWVDLLRRETFGGLLEGLDAVAHLGEAPHANAIRGPEALFANNTAIGSGVMQAAADAGVKRFLYASTSQVYGFWGTGKFPPDLVPTSWPMPEDQPVRPLNAYSLSKVANEGYARYVSQTSEMTFAVVRFPAALELHSHWMRQMSSRIDQRPNEGFYVQANVLELADGFARALTHDLPSKFNIYHFAAPDVLGDIPLRDRLKKFFPQLPDLPADWPDHASPVSTERARRELGWTHSSLRDAVSLL